MKIGGEAMKCLKIEEGKGFFSLDGSMWTHIDQIKKEDLLILVKLALSEEYEYDKYEDELIFNSAQQIVYKHISERLFELNINRIHFKDESEALFKEAIDKYSIM